MGEIDPRIKVGQYKGRGIGVLTSGGDSQGMNACLRAIVRMALYVGCKVYYIREGYQGMIDGDMEEATWASVSSIIHKGGTVIGSARSKEFFTMEGKLKAVKNLVLNNICNLIVIGGDGSLTGADELKKLWPSLVEKLVQQGKINADQAKVNHSLRVVGTVGTIDNDFYGTDMTIGADSALHRIQEAVDAITSTAFSHKRTFILEVMGRHCGYLALKTALTSEADYVFIPEMPPPVNWTEELHKKIKLGFETGKRLHIIILAEGAVDVNHKPITAEKIKSVLVDKLKIDTRITVLGHVQRGGHPSAFDRILGSRLGAEAVIALMEQHPEDEPVVIGINANEIQRIKLTTAVTQVKAVKDLLDNNQYEKAIELRGRSFQRNLEVFKILSRLEPKHDQAKIKNVYNFAILQIGTPVCGMNASVFSFVRNCIDKGGRVYGIYGGIEGFIDGNFHEIKWGDVNGIVSQGGSILGTKRIVPTDDMYPQFAEQFKKFRINAFLIIGGFEGFVTAMDFVKKREEFKEFCIPIALIPATINNNVPGSDFSIGADTALNIITRMCDLFRQSASGTKRRVFVVETMGGKCGYLCTTAGLASGADAAYIFEEPYSITDLTKEVYHMKHKMRDGGILRGLILRNELSSINYNTDFITRLFAEEGKEQFTARKNILGHLQQGDTPTVFDRGLAVKLSVKAVQWFYDQFETAKQSKGYNVFTKGDDSAAVIGMFGNRYCHTPVSKLAPLADFELARCEWWMELRPLLKILARHETLYNMPSDLNCT